MPRTRRTYTPEFKVEAVKLVTEQGYSVAEAARSLGISENLIRNWKHAALPRHIPAGDLDRVLDSFRDASPKSRRNLAILLLLARLGMRANEVVQLRLGDIDWRGARLIM